MNNMGDSHCYHCGAEDHWANGCPGMAEKQQAQLHMTMEEGEEEEQGVQAAHQFLHVCMAQSQELPDWQAYLDECSTMMVFKSKKHLSNIPTVACGVKINCNAENLKTNQEGDYGSMSAWYIPEGIANIFSMNKLEKKYRITTAGKGTTKTRMAYRTLTYSCRCGRKRQKLHLCKWCGRITKGSPRKIFYKPRKQDVPWY